MSENKVCKPRYVCDNWDEGAPVTLHSHGRYRLPERKVLTTGIVEIKLTKTQTDTLTAQVRQGREIRLTSHYGNGCINRFFPCMDKEGNLVLAAQSMLPFRREIYEGKHVSIVGNREGGTVTKEQFAESVKAISKAKREHVTPETLVKCPSCGTEFKVGKSLV